MGLRLHFERYEMTSQTVTSQAEELIARARELFSEAHDSASLENAKARFLGKQGAITAMLKSQEHWNLIASAKRAPASIS